MSWLQAIFGGNNNSTPPQQPAPGAQNVDPKQQVTQNSGQTAPNGVIPKQEGEPSPLAKHAELWKTDPNAQKEQDPGLGNMFANLDPKKVLESAQQVDFTKVVPAEIWSKVKDGGEGAQEALAQAINKVAQTQYAQSTLATTKIVEQALAKAEESFQARLPQLLKQQNTSEALAANPIYSNPALQPLVEAVKQQLVVKNPNATSAELKTQVEDYFAELGKAFAPAPKESSGGKNKQKDQDWSRFLSD